LHVLEHKAQTRLPRCQEYIATLERELAEAVIQRDANSDTANQLSADLDEANRHLKSEVDRHRETGECLIEARVMELEKRLGSPLPVVSWQHDVPAHTCKPTTGGTCEICGMRMIL
jgi:hypothetical protein